MGSLPNPFSSGSSSSVNTGAAGNDLSTLLSDATLGSNIMGDTTGASLLGGGSTGSFSDFINALNNSVATPSGTQAPPQAAAAQASPVDTGGGTQSNITSGQGGTGGATVQPGETGPQSPRQTTPTVYQEDSELNKLLRMVTGQPKGPTWILPQVRPGETGPQAQQAVPGQTPAQILNSIFGSQPTDASIPPEAPQGGDISVHKPSYLDPTIRAQGPGAGAGVAATQPQPYLPENDPIATGPGSSPVPQQPPTQLPQGPQPRPQPGQPPQPQVADPQQMSALERDLHGIQRGDLASLVDLATRLYSIGAPLAIGLRGKGIPGVDLSPGLGLPLLHDMLGGGRPQGGPDPNKVPPERVLSPKEAGTLAGPPEKTPTSNQIPGVTAKIADDFIRSEAAKRGIDPNVASRYLGQESSYGQNNLGDWTGGKPGVGEPTSFGPLQLHFAKDGNAMGDQFYRDTHLDPRDFAHNWKQQIMYALDKAAIGGWGPWLTSMKALGYNQWSGINRKYAATNKVSRQVKPGQLPPTSQPMVMGR